MIGTLAFGGLSFALSTVAYLYALGIFRTAAFGDQGFKPVVAVATTLGIIVGAWVGARVFRWLAAPREPI
jgi:uncharacterized membrane protein YfcA